MSDRDTTETPYVTASIVSAAGQPQWSTTQPPMANPPTVPRMPAIASSVFAVRSEEHTSELQSRVDISYAVFCLETQEHTSELQSREAITCSVLCWHSTRHE